MSAAKAKRGGIALGAGLLVGWYVYARATKAAEESLRQGVCATAPPGALQTLAQAVRRAGSSWSTFLEDAGLGAAGVVDVLARLESLNLVQPDLASDFYAWWNNLTPAQKAQVQLTEDGQLTCAAAETGSQLAVGGSALTSAAVAGLVAYVIADLVVED